MKQNIETTCQDKNDAEFEKQVDEVCEQWKSFFREPYTGIDINGIAMPEVMRTAHTEGYDAFRRNMAVFYKLYGFNDHTSYGDYILSGRRGQDMINSANPVEWDRVIAAWIINQNLGFGLPRTFLRIYAGIMHSICVHSAHIIPFYT